MLTPGTGDSVLFHPSLPLAFIQGAINPNRSSFDIYLRTPLYIYIPTAGSLPCHLPRQKRMGQRRLSSPGRRRSHRGRPIRSVLRRRDTGGYL